MVGEDGTLYANERMPGTSDEHRTYVYGVSAGQFRPGAWGVVVWLLGRQLIYRVHPERITER